MKIIHRVADIILWVIAIFVQRNANFQGELPKVKGILDLALMGLDCEHLIGVNQLMKKVVDNSLKCVEYVSRLFKFYIT